MVDRLESLLKGYGEFRSTTYAGYRDLYAELSEHGQSPEIMVIACCDSRVEPSAIFNAAPGALFVVRNVANLVPPYEAGGDYHGTSAALEFAVVGLGIKRIVVLGHAKCGGVKAFLDNAETNAPTGRFIDKWMSILEPARALALAHKDHAGADAAQRALEQAAIGVSIDNLKTFPFVRERLEAGELTLHGGYFYIGTGTLLAYREADRSFEPVWPESRAGSAAKPS